MICSFQPARGRLDAGKYWWIDFAQREIGIARVTVHYTGMSKAPSTPDTPPIRPFKVHIVNRDHPIARGVNDFVVTDEQHFVTYDKDPKYVLARSINEDGLEYTDHAGRRSNTAEAVWAYDYGKGRVCFMAPGHMITVLWNPEYMTMQENAARWLLRES